MATRGLYLPPEGKRVPSLAFDLNLLNSIRLLVT